MNVTSVGEMLIYQHVFLRHSIVKLSPSLTYRFFHRGMAEMDPNVKKMGKKRKSKTERITTRREKYLTKIEATGLKGMNPPANISIRVLGSGTNCTSKALVVDFMSFKCLFNCSEGTQRILGDQKLRLARVENVFITKSRWKNLSGLSGLHLTIDVSPVSVLKLTGAESMKRLMQLCGSTADFRTTKLEITGVSDGFVDNDGMRTDFIEIHSTSHNSVTSQSPAGEEPDMKRPRTNDDFTSSIAYLCSPYPDRRRVSVDRMLELGVPRDKTIGRLVNGETVQLEDGREIKPDDILLPEVPVFPFLVMECEDLSYLPSLHTCSKLQRFYKDGHSDDSHCDMHVETTHNQGPSDSTNQGPQTASTLGLVVHFTPVSVMLEPEYQQWMKRFGVETKHLVLNDWGSDVVMERPYMFQVCLNQTQPDIFPLLKHQIQQPELLQKAPIDVENVTIGHPGLSYIIRGKQSPHNTFSSENCIKLDNEKFLERFQSEELSEELVILQNKMKGLTEKDRIDDREYPELVFLGTGSAIPTPGRNVSAILVHLSENSCMLLDAGEDTAGQILRFYGDQAEEVLCKLEAVFISHRHADHHMGMMDVILERERCLKNKGIVGRPLLVFAPHRYNLFLCDIAQIFHVDMNEKVQFISAQSLLDELSGDVIKLQAQLKDLELPISSIKTCKVNHRKDPFGLTLKLQDGYKLVYSGDTTPCEDLITDGKDCDLLIHESTMEDDLVEDAVLKSHSTTSQAIEVGKRMNAGFTILTHFSQRYSKLTLTNDNFHDRMALAFDNMRVSPRKLHLLPHLLPAIKAMWSEHYEQIELITFRRNIRRARDKLISETRENESETRENESETRENKSETRENGSESMGNESETRGNESETREKESETTENKSETREKESETRENESETTKNETKTKSQSIKMGVTDTESKCQKTEEKLTDNQDVIAKPCVASEGTDLDKSGTDSNGKAENQGASDMERVKNLVTS